MKPINRIHVFNSCNGSCGTELAFRVNVVGATHGAGAIAVTIAKLLNCISRSDRAYLLLKYSQECTQVVTMLQTTERARYSTYQVSVWVLHIPTRFGLIIGEVLIYAPHDSEISRNPLVDSCQLEHSATARHTWASAQGRSSRSFPQNSLRRPGGVITGHNNVYAMHCQPLHIIVHYVCAIDTCQVYRSRHRYDASQYYSSRWDITRSRSADGIA